MAAWPIAVRLWIQPPPTLAARMPLTVLIAVAAVIVSIAWWSGRELPWCLPIGHEVAKRPWLLLTDIFPHLNVLHLAFNLFWWWRFAGWIELVWGTARLAGLVAVLAVTSSAAQIALSEVGVGLSGVGYGLFGLLWVLGRADSRFAGAVDRQTVQLFAIWFVFCIVTTWVDVWPVGNEAHAAGALAGVAIGLALTRRKMRRVAWIAATTALAVLSVIGATIARPWVNYTTDWQGHAGYVALMEGDIEAGLALIRQALETSPLDARLWTNLGIALQTQGRYQDAAAAYERAIELDASFREDLAPSLEAIAVAQAQQALERDDLGEALAWADRVLKLSPANVEAREIKARVIAKQALEEIENDDAPSVEASSTQP